MLKLVENFEVGTSNLTILDVAEFIWGFGDRIIDYCGAEVKIIQQD